MKQTLDKKAVEVVLDEPVAVHASVEYADNTIQRAITRFTSEMLYEVYRERLKRAKHEADA